MSDISWSLAVPPVGDTVCHCLDAFGASKSVSQLACTSSLSDFFGWVMSSAFCMLYVHDFSSVFISLKLLPCSVVARSCFQRAHFKAEPYDIMLCDSHDLTTFEGVVQLMRMILAFLDLKFFEPASTLSDAYACAKLDHLDLRSPLRFRLTWQGILVCGPPCSLFVQACVSVHRRTKQNVWGNLNNFRVRCANRIWINFASWLSCHLAHLVSSLVCCIFCISHHFTL